MGVFKDLLGRLFTSADGKGLLEQGADIVDRFVETAADKQEAKLEWQKFLHTKELEIKEQAAEAEQRFNDRIKALEGTASDLNQAGWPGRIVLFLRGLQRPVWGFLTLYLDIQVFSQAWKIEEGSLQETAFLAINVLVLFFLFGERAVKNVMPFVSKYLEKRKK